MPDALPGLLCTLDQIIFGTHVPGRELRQEYSPRRTVTLQRLAISTVLARLRECRQKARTSPLRYAYIAGRIVTRAFRIVEGKAVVDRDRISCASKSLLSIKRTSLVATRANCVIPPVPPQRADSFLRRPAGADQLEKIAIREVFFIKATHSSTSALLPRKRLRPTSPCARRKEGSTLHLIR